MQIGLKTVLIHSEAKIECCQSFRLNVITDRNYKNILSCSVFV